MSDATITPQLQNAVRRLFATCLDQCRQEVAEYLAQNGDHATPEAVAAACPATFGDQTLAAWAIEQNRHGERRLAA